MQLKSLLFLILVPILLAGCGGGDSASSPHGVSQVAASQSCASGTCHGTQISPITEKLIADEWRGSSHMTQNAAGCADCHEPDAGHPNLCNKCHGGGGFAVTKDADSAGKCGKCHGLSFPDDVMMAQAPQHYGYSSARVPSQKPRASYVSAQYQGRCRACHNSHDSTVTPQHREYAKSLHGDPQGAAWTYYDFKQDNRAACNRCHTSTGYINFVTSGFTVATKGFSTGDASREMLACDACHASYDFKNSIRRVAAFTAPYTGYDGSTAARFPSVSKSNLCIPCHSGHVGGQAINAIAEAKFSDTGFVNSHYLAAAGLMYMQNGFINFTSLTAPIVVESTFSTYGKTLSPDNVSTPGGMEGGQTSTHRRFGTTLINNYWNLAFFAPGVGDQNGPCVTCHLNVNGTPQRPGSGHSLKIDANTYKQLCVVCHTSEGTHDKVVQLTAENFRAEFLKPQAEAFEDSLEQIRSLLQRRHQISYNGTYPYFYDDALPLKDGKKQPLKDWTRGGTANGRKLMGACYNFNLLTRDPAAYAHARSYSRRLIYDSIDFLDDGRMNLSVGATATSSSLGLTRPDGTPVFVKDSKAYNVAAGRITTIFGTTTDAMLFLIGWNRSTGDWNATERP